MWCIASWTEVRASSWAGSAYTHHANSATDAGRIAIYGLPDVGGRAQTTHGDVLRPGRFHPPLFPIRSRRVPGGGACISAGMYRRYPALRWAYRSTPWGWTLGLLWLSPSP